MKSVRVHLLPHWPLTLLLYYKVVCWSWFFLIFLLHIHILTQIFSLGIFRHGCHSRKWLLFFFLKWQSWIEVFEKHIWETWERSDQHYSVEGSWPLLRTQKQCYLNHRSSDSETSLVHRRLPHLRSGPPEGNSASHDPQTDRWLPSVQLGPSVWGRYLCGTATQQHTIYQRQTRGIMSNRKSR